MNKLKVLIGQVTYQGRVLSSQVIGGENDYDRTISVTYPLYYTRCDESTGWEFVNERTVAEEEWTMFCNSGSRAHGQAAMAAYTNGHGQCWVEAEAWYQPNFTDLKFEIITKEIDL